jgi:hypothetical protein
VKPTFSFVIDVIGTCNLACPSCPVGNFQEVRDASGVMSPELLEKILEKADSECTVEYIALYNWTEPLLHPGLPKLIRAVHGHGFRCFLSSNLNRLRGIEDVLRESPELLRVSVSGFVQERYGVTHRNGDIERVKANMAELARLRDRTWSATKVQVAFHRYLGNHEDEALMKSYARSLGFEFAPAWAYLMPLEKNLAFLGDTSTRATITPADRALIDRLALRPDEASRAAQAHKDTPCSLQQRQIALDVAGNVMLCCTVYDREAYGVGPYLDVPLAELQRRREAHPLCTPCMSRGLHVVAAYGAPEFDRIALDRAREAHPEARLGTPEHDRVRAPRYRMRKVLGALARASGIGGKSVS